MDVGKKWIATSVAALFLAAMFSEFAWADQTYTITVSGEGKVTAIPDKVQIVCSVSAESKKIGEAVTLQTEKVNKFLDGLRNVLGKKNLDPKDVATLSYHYEPVYDFKRSERVFSGYKVSQHFRVQTSVDKAGPVLGRVTDEAFVDNVQFTVSDVDALKEQAVNLAIDDAKDTAKRRAVRLGVKLGAILGYQESSVVPQPRRMLEMMMTDIISEPRLPAGEAEITARVSITYELVK